MPDYSDRIELARHIIDFEPETAPLGAIGLKALTPVAWPAGLAPAPEPLTPVPASDAPLPSADVLVVTWTVAELRALADVLTPGIKGEKWYRYDRNFAAQYVPKIKDGAPALRSKRLGSYFLTRIGNKRVLCFKSELHLNQDGIALSPGVATLPVKDLWKQLIDEVKPSLVVTTGTAGATFADHELGDVMVTTSAQFRLQKEFRNATFKDSKFSSPFVVPETYVQTANNLMAAHANHLVEPDFGPPTKRYVFPAGLVKAPKNTPDIKLFGKHGLPLLPILTTDFFEFGTSSNGLEAVGCGVEMGDAVLGLVVSEMATNPTPWVVVRNASDPQINGDLPAGRPDMQAHWAVWYYDTYGYWTSVNSAIATWAIIAGLL